MPDRDQVSSEGISKQACDGVKVAGRLFCRHQLFCVVGQVHRNFRMGECKAFDKTRNMSDFRGQAFLELFSGRRVEKEIRHDNICAFGRTRLRTFHDGTPSDDHPCAFKGSDPSGFCTERHLRDCSNARERFAAEPEGHKRVEVGDIGNFTGRVGSECEYGIVG